MTVPYKELRDHSLAIEMDVYEAAGRVVVWKWDRGTSGTNAFVGDLV